MVIWTYRATIQNWVDGDTVDLEVDLGFRITFRDRFRLVREDGGWFNAPEVRGDEAAAGKIAHQVALDVLPVGTQVTVTTFKNDRRGKYGRWLVHIPGVICAIEAALRPLQDPDSNP